MSDDEKTVWKKVKKMSNGEPRMSMEEPGNLEGNAVFTLSLIHISSIPRKYRFP